ncbi:hypothetical protein RZ532_13965 [Nitratireductor aquimarinus]|uniref:hypothetical protein n=1 Tax=Nitratireductor aquimarinus TaxID=889300 RepID=UPI002936349B|nr:hypothetical protein [Nitratireductor aquimarinus]MDV2967092.1 hypothetical protein [Nitratireductor aquimarinus]
MAKPQILIVVGQLLKLGGKERDALAVARKLGEEGHPFQILTRAAAPELAEELPIICLERVPHTNHAALAALAKTADGMKRSGKADIVLTFERIGPADFFYAADLHQEWSWQKRLLPRYSTLSRLAQRLFESPRQFSFFLGEQQALEYSRVYHLREERFRILSPVIHADRADELRRIAQECKPENGERVRLLSIATSAENKGVDLSIRAIARCPDAQLTVIGLKSKDAKRKGRTKPMIA